MKLTFGQLSTLLATVQNPEYFMGAQTLANVRAGYDAAALGLAKAFNAGCTDDDQLHALTVEVDIPDDMRAKFKNALMAQRNDLIETLKAFGVSSQITPGFKATTGCFDRNGVEIFLGDKVRYHLEGSHTKKEYWNPEYEVIWQPPKFTLRHIGGGKDGNSHDFILKHGGANGYLVKI